jgi:ABC-type uncharacterized transport system involved in gliding motility auxiliary subunit
MKRTQKTAVLFLLSLAAFAFAFLLSGTLFFRADLTRNKVYTISEATKNLFKEIEDQVSITYYISPALAAAYSEPGAVEDFLNEYAAASQGRVRVVVREPDAAMVMGRLGLLARQIQTVEENRASAATVYSGLLIEYLDRSETISWVFATETLEYELAGRIKSMIGGVERKIGVMIGSADMSWENDFAYLDAAMKQAGYTIEQISPGDAIPDTLPGLFVIGGMSELDATALYRIDRYIALGGPVLFMIEGVAVESRSSLQAQALTQSGLIALVSWYGATVQPSLALDVSGVTLDIQDGDAVQTVRYPFWFAVSGGAGNAGHPISAGFAGLDLFWASPIELNPPFRVAAEALFVSSSQAWLETAAGGFSLDTGNPQAWTLEQADTRGIKIFGAALSGVCEPWYDGLGKPSPDLPSLPVEPAASRLVVLGDMDIGSSFIEFSGSDRDLNFLIYAADWLTNDDDIIAIKSRAPAAGRLDKITDENQRAAAMTFSRFLNTVIVPLAVAALGLLLAYQRRRVLKRLQKMPPLPQAGGGGGG